MRRVTGDRQMRRVTGDLGYNKVKVRAVRPVAALGLYGRREKSGLARIGSPDFRSRKAARANNPRNEESLAKLGGASPSFPNKNHPHERWYVESDDEGHEPQDLYPEANKGIHKALV